VSQPIASERATVMQTRKVCAGRYETLDFRYTILSTEFGWHIFAGQTCDDGKWINGAYETKKDALAVIERIEANPIFRAEVDLVLAKGY
jgi:hypothetical protein